MKIISNETGETIANILTNHRPNEILRMYPQ